MVYSTCLQETKGRKRDHSPELVVEESDDDDVRPLNNKPRKTPGRDSEDDDDQDPEDEDDEDKHQQQQDAHCNYHFIKNTRYTLICGDKDKEWASCIFTDPSPKIADDCGWEPGDYLKTSGNKLTLKGRVSATFSKEDMVILTTNFEAMEDDMTGQDLVDLEDQEFLIWWQNIKPPKAKPKTKGAPTKRTRKA